MSSRPRFSRECRPSEVSSVSSLRATSLSASPDLTWNEPRTTSMNGRNGVCRPSGEQLPVRMKMLLAEAAAEFVQQARLAHPRLGHDVDYVKFAARLGEGALQNLQFALAAE